jgi:hypothetical protein
MNVIQNFVDLINLKYKNIYYCFVNVIQIWIADKPDIEE